MLQPTYTPQAKQHWPITRQFSRRQVETRITIETSGQRYRGWSIDLGEGGLGFMCPAPLQARQEISASLELDSDLTIHFRAVVRHTRGFRHGCEFLTILPEHRAAIVRFVSQEPVGNSTRPKARAAAMR